MPGEHHSPPALHFGAQGHPCWGHRAGTQGHDSDPGLSLVGTQGHGRGTGLSLVGTQSHGRGTGLSLMGTQSHGRDTGLSLVGSTGSLCCDPGESKAQSSDRGAQPRTVLGSSQAKVWSEEERGGSKGCCEVLVPTACGTGGSLLSPHEELSCLHHEQRDPATGWTQPCLGPSTPHPGGSGRNMGKAL